MPGRLFLSRSACVTGTAVGAPVVQSVAAGVGGTCHAGGSVAATSGVGVAEKASARHSATAIMVRGNWTKRWIQSDQPIPSGSTDQGSCRPGDTPRVLAGFQPYQRFSDAVSPCVDSAVRQRRSCR